ncbi:LA_3751/LA_3752 family putative glycosyltransferase [Leptothoe sp. PORK10 BA2]|uniref:LA_3751/LA_3752 family putative glycosyltransferase n=1 Tax=Leptothoe sp. PORK10 BA2 TaxID=3110254 RepID=UPI002B215974|nr:hypothetical protein [Leptothoe sp. PORK10 BA2]MEA5462313.1 hypothetical protein [Leptothoe sp. PORK10 BA2]
MLPKLPWLMLVGGMVFTLGLQLYARNGVFFSGDGGLKALLTQQFATGDWHFALRLSAPDWVVGLWQQGLYPFTPPYVYERAGQHFITFPFPFSALTAPFYRVLGYKGLYVVPLLALWLIWIRFVQIGEQLRWRADVLAISLGVVIFASPLTLYGAMYWEHTLAVCLVFWGMTLVLWPGDTTVSGPQALVAGSLLGLAVWFRSELICLAAIIVGLTFLQWISRRAWLPTLHGKAHLFMAGILVTIAVFFGLNHIIYGHFLGIHALQVVEESSISQQISQAVANYKQLLNALLQYFPFTLWVLAMTVLAGPGEWRESRQQIITTWLILLLFVLAVPLIIPPGAGGKQWGARFYLMIIPMLALIGGIYMNDLLKQRGGWKRYFILGSMAVAFVAGAELNVYHGTMTSYRDSDTNSTSLRYNYAPIAPAIAAINQHSSPYIAMSHQFVAQQLWAATPDKLFFLTESTADVYTLADGLYQQGHEQFLYICYPHRPCPTPAESNPSVSAADTPLQLQFSDIGTFGKYPLYDVTISQLVTAPGT